MNDADENELREFLDARLGEKWVLIAEYNDKVQTLFPQSLVDVLGLLQFGAIRAETELGVKMIRQQRAAEAARREASDAQPS